MVLGEERGGERGGEDEKEQKRGAGDSIFNNAEQKVKGAGLGGDNI